MATLNIPNSFSPNSTIQSAKVNENFEAVEASINNISNDQVADDADIEESKIYLEKIKEKIKEKIEKRNLNSFTLIKKRVGYDADSDLRNILDELDIDYISED